MSCKCKILWFLTASSLPNNSVLVNSDLQVLFWNARSVVKKEAELERLLADLDVLVVVKSWLKPEIDFKIPGFKVYRRDRLTTASGGMIFIVRNDIRFSPINIRVEIYPTVETAAITIKGFSKPINIFAVYRAPGENHRSKTLIQEQWEPDGSAGKG